MAHEYEGNMVNEFYVDEEEQDAESVRLDRVVKRVSCNGCGHLQYSGYSFWCNKVGYKCSTGGVPKQECA